MVDITSGCTINLISGHDSYYKELFIETAATADTADTIVIDLTKYSALYLKSILGNVMTTANSVLVTEEPATSVTTGTLTITVGGSTVSDKARTYRVIIA